MLEQKQEKWTKASKNWETNDNKMLLKFIFNFKRYRNLNNYSRTIIKSNCLQNVDVKKTGKCSYLYVSLQEQHILEVLQELPKKPLSFGQFLLINREALEEYCRKKKQECSWQYLSAEVFFFLKVTIIHSTTMLFRPEITLVWNNLAIRDAKLNWLENPVVWSVPSFLLLMNTLILPQKIIAVENNMC